MQGFKFGVLKGQLLPAGFSWTCSGVSPTLPACLLCSALAVLASGSGVSTERESFMGLVKNEIDRLNEDMGARGSVSMVFHAGGVKVGCLAGRESALDCMSVLVSTKHCRLVGFTCLIVAAWVLAKRLSMTFHTGGRLPGRHQV